MTIEQLYPANGNASLLEIEDRLRQSREWLQEPFSHSLLSFFAKLSETLFAANRTHQFPELQALAFWMRKAAILRLRDGFLSGIHPEVLVAPRGVSFHVTPSNVDTMPIYSLLLSLICGNSNVVRVSSRSGDQFQLVVQCLGELLADETTYPGVSKLITLIRYDRTRGDVTQLLSQNCDTRVLWGGDQAIDAIRQSPIHRDAIDVVFPDRTSWAVVNAAHWNTLSSDARDKLLKNFYNDTLALDQLACSSPQILLWIGSPSECREASVSFWREFEQLATDREYAIDGATNLKKLASAWTVAMQSSDLESIQRGRKITVATLNDWTSEDHRGCGAGFFFEHHLDGLSEFASHVGERDQTLTYAGFRRKEIHAMAATLLGRGFTRFIPFGAALEFSNLWEGSDLLVKFTKQIHIR